MESIIEARLVSDVESWPPGAQLNCNITLSKEILAVRERIVYELIFSDNMIGTGLVLMPVNDRYDQEIEIG